MKTTSVLAVCLAVIVAITAGSCRSGNKHGSHRAVIEDNNPMSEKDHLPPDVSVRLRKSGGLIHVEREWLFYSDGKIRHPNGDITTLEEKSVRGLLSQKKIDALTDLEPEYPPPVGSADFETMELTVRGSGGIFRTRAADSSESVPDKLWDLWDALQDAARRSLAESTRK